ncbi:MAG: hypothetical protein FJ398_01675 [Verrucomicrobia bacterium]|nr:hypothetical protein [Verrucomicrobiota bacterium]
MSYLTLEVQIDHGRVLPKEPGKLPETGSGLLTILESAPTETSSMTPLEAFRELQRQLQLTPEKAQVWKATIREARR